VGIDEELMMAQTMEKKRAALLAGIFLLAGASVFGGEPPPPPPGAAEKPPEEKKPDEKRPSDEKPFVFESRGRRDPFTFAIKPTIIEATPNTQPGEVVGPNLDPALIRQKKAEAEQKYVEAENIFMDIGKEGRAMEAIAKCDEGLKVFTDTPNYGAIAEWQPVRARLENLRKASERMKQRHDAEKKFREVNIRLTGVVARERKSQAIVNGKTVGKGDIVAASDNYDVSVDDIHPDQVVFVTPDGFKVKLTWTEMSK
jgi:hypothetical protein